MIPAVTAFLPRRRRRPEPPPDGPLGAGRYALVDSLPDPKPLDPVVFGTEPRVEGER